MSKILVCRCEDVLLSDLESAIATGNEDIESLKRFTGFGTGVCQGKSCLAHAALILAARRRASPDAILPFTPRPPVAPLALGLLAAGEELSEPPIVGHRPRGDKK
ncbi:MAG: (2Fe-2S)-binding protein [Deltaproteobacteria bacterium]|nr:(2Fe-2S)-binding protein [Deltaproteobacteria bacterium]